MRKPHARTFGHYIYVHDGVISNSCDLGCSFVGNEIPFLCRGDPMSSRAAVLPAGCSYNPEILSGETPKNSHFIYFHTCCENGEI